MFSHVAFKLCKWTDRPDKQTYRQHNTLHPSVANGRLDDAGAFNLLPWMVDILF